MAKRVPLNLTLPATMKAWIDQRVERGEFPTPDLLIEHALRRAKQVHSRSELEAAALRGLDSGPATPLTRRDWTRMEAELRRRVAARAPRRKSA